MRDSSIIEKVIGLHRVYSWEHRATNRIVPYVCFAAEQSFLYPPPPPIPLSMEISCEYFPMFRCVLLYVCINTVGTILLKQLMLVVQWISFWYLPEISGVGHSPPAEFWHFFSVFFCCCHCCLHMGFTVEPQCSPRIGKLSVYDDCVLECSNEQPVSTEEQAWLFLGLAVTLQLLLVLGLYCHQVFHRVIRIITLYFLDCWKNW